MLITTQKISLIHPHFLKKKEANQGYSEAIFMEEH